MRVNVKALSANQMWRGRQFKTKEYTTYEVQLTSLLRPLVVPDGPLEMHITFGLSSAGSDLDNCVKGFLDILQKKYGFNDNRVYRLVLEKVKTKKGEEFIDFSCLAWTP